MQIGNIKFYPYPYPDSTRGWTPFDKTVVGTCSHCGGKVTLPNVIWSVVPPEPTCETCGAVAQKPQLPVIPMEPPPKASAEYVFVQRRGSTSGQGVIGGLLT